MNFRPSLLVVLVTLTIALPSLLLAQEQAPPQVENAKQSYAGAINANSVFVRSGPSENYYPTMKLNKGDAVTVVGIKFDWLKIVPPEGSFSYVPKAYVEKRGDGTKGRLTKAWMVKAGSSLNAMKTTVQAQLEQGADVDIVGEQDEYFKIKPPAGSYLYVNKQFVEPVKAIEAPAVAEGQNTSPAVANDGATEPAANNATAIETPRTDDSTASAESPATQPTAETPSTGGVASATLPPTTQASEAADAQFDKLESEFADISKKPIEEQPVPDLLTRYQELSKNTELPSSMLRIVDLRIAALKVRADTREQFVALKKIQEESQKRQMALKAEKQELDERIKNGPQIYTAVGTLQMSSLQLGPGALYRLTDPATGRTVVYVRTDDTKYTALLGKFIGVRGDVTTDPKLNLKCIAPKSAEPVDPSKVNGSVAAQIIPPSMVPQASTGNP